MEQEIKNALGALVNGETIVYPTDTVWGIGCDATNQDAVRKVYALKERDESKSLIMLVNGFDMLAQHVDEIPIAVKKIMTEALRPTTVIYSKGKNLAQNAIHMDGSVAIRVTSDPFCAALIARLGNPIVSTSANKSGEKTPARFSDIDPTILKGAGYVVQLLHHEEKSAEPSVIVSVTSDGSVSVIRP